MDHTWIFDWIVRTSIFPRNDRVCAHVHAPQNTNIKSFLCIIFHAYTINQKYNLGGDATINIDILTTSKF